MSIQAPGPPRSVAVRLLGAAALLAAAGTYLAAQIDYVRRHQPRMPPEKYWVPQLTHIWLPGLLAAATLAVAAFALHRKGRSH